MLPPRVVQAVLDAVGQVPGLWRDYVLKGGLVLQHVYGSPRRSGDLDFNSVLTYPARLTPENTERLFTFCRGLDEGLGRVAPRHGYAHMAVQRKWLSEWLPVIFAEVGYTRVEEEGAPYAQAVEVQATLCERMCETRRAEIGGVEVHVPVLEDILADKLKVFIQQPVRDTFRSTDLYDLWYFATESRHTPDPDRLVAYLREKCAAWEEILPVTRARFYDPAVRVHVVRDFDLLREEVPPEAPFPEADAAFDAVMALVDTLALPEA